MSGIPNNLTRCAGAICNLATAKCLPSPFNTERSLHLHTSYFSKFLLDLLGMKLRLTFLPERVIISSAPNLRSANSGGTAISSGTNPSTSTNYLTSSSASSARCSFTYCNTLKKRSDCISSFSLASLNILV